jgi:hypothetical protein
MQDYSTEEFVGKQDHRIPTISDKPENSAYNKTQDGG